MSKYKLRIKQAQESAPMFIFRKFQRHWIDTLKKEMLHLELALLAQMDAHTFDDIVCRPISKASNYNLCDGTVDD